MSNFNRIIIRSNIIMVELKLSYVCEIKICRDKGWGHDNNSMFNMVRMYTRIVVSKYL